MGAHRQGDRSEGGRQPLTARVRRVVVVTAAVLAAVVFFLLATLPPRTLRASIEGVDRELRARTVAGAYHVHTARSDGAGSKEDVAAAAARAGLDFVILTDHGDGTQPPDLPAYVSGVLAIDAVEISTNGGHYVALGMAPSSYPLGGEASAVVEDVRRLGGFGVAAHPDHPTRELAWGDWNAQIDGLEWINTDAEWRDERAVRLARVLFDYLVRPAPAVASIFDRPVATLERWDTLEKRRPVIALAATDAHGGARARRRPEKRGMFGIGPSYEASFRSLSNRVILDRPLTGDATGDARLLLQAIRAGRVYSVVDAISPDVVLRVSPEEGFEVVSMLPEGAQRFAISQAARRRLELHARTAAGEPRVPWVVSNWLGPHESEPPAGIQSPDPGQIIPLPIASEWRVEKDASSSGRVSAAGDVVALEYTLGAGDPASQFAAAAADLRDAEDIRGLLFRGRATKPMRVSVQLRFAPDDRRWGRSIYLDSQEREIVIDLRTMVAAERGSLTMPSTSAARSVLFVVDLVNARPGDAGAFTISGLRGGK